MDKKETARIMAFVSAAIDKPITRATIETYHEMLKDLPYDLVNAGVKKVIAEYEYPVIPTIGAIRKAVFSVKNMDRLTGPQAYKLVVRAVSSFGHYREREALESMPEEVAEVVESMGWRDICLSERPDVVRGQFLKMYDVYTQRNQELEMLPGDVRDMLSGIGKKLELPEGKEKKHD